MCRDTRGVFIERGRRQNYRQAPKAASDAVAASKGDESCAR